MPKPNMTIINRILTGIYAASSAVLTLLVDQGALPPHTAADIGVIIATFATGFHGSQTVAAVSSKRATPNA